ncbi:unnamed protein product [Arctia plantaginis]|uniref:Peptidase aspartic putative domain-containing protein n=1 Tax=Arctia plantaginis TaxID=874455 RepID=A0A8S1A7T1_ARCPL|nr:unnamed protein product [Arctia plantaginis]
MTSESELQLLVRKRSSLKAKLTHFSSYMNVLLGCDTVSNLQCIELEGRLRKFEAIYDEFDVLQLQIEMLSDKPDEAYTERAKFEDRFHQLAAQARSVLTTARATDDVGSVASSECKQTGDSFHRGFIRLPKIDLPSFDGGYQYWLEYRDTYLSLIHSSSSIDNISKFHYLRASLKGDALEIIKNIDFKSEHYQMAWKLLCDRYDNSRLLVNNHVQALFNVEKLSKESCFGLRRLTDVINKNMRALKTLNEPTEYWDTLIVYMMSIKLDSVTSRDWEEHRSTLDKSPSLSQFCSFITLVKVVDSRGNKVDARILLDNGSTANFITQTLCDELGLPRRDTSSMVTGICNQTTVSRQSCDLTLESRSGDYKLNINCFVLPEIAKVPSLSIDFRSIPLPSHIQLADPTFFISSAVDILVGAEVFWDILGSAHINLGKNKPIIRDTKLGWIVSGSIGNSGHSSMLRQSHVCNLSLRELNNNLNKFWELDSVSSKHSLSQTERACEDSFHLHTTRDENGRFVVTMPLKEDPKVLGESYERAKLRFLSLERRFRRDPVFKERYISFMQEYERLGHMTETPTPRKPHSGGTIEYFLPHHGVIKESSVSTKLRVVFDGSAATTSGVSLNDLQMVGPSVQDDLFAILLRFRQHKFVISGDVEKMYRSVFLTPLQRPLTQILFRIDPTLPLKIYRLNTVTYGTSAGPYLATKCLVTLASETSNERAKAAIQRDFYVDDYLSGGESVSEVVKMTKEVITVLGSAGFHLRKWQSNSPDILNKLAVDAELLGSLNLSENSNVSAKTLGLHWVCESDTLAYSINTNKQTQTEKQITKRHILSVISQIFDPLGLIGPCIVEAKLIMQKLWKERSEQIPGDIQLLWVTFTKKLPCLNSLKVPRWVLCDNSIAHELHIFTDASERAYGACIYVRSVNVQGSSRVHLLVSKNRVAPIKPTTIPKLELCGALLGARLCTEVLKALTLPINTCRFWCDSTIVLSWLSMSPNLLKPFVRNRVDEIQESTAGYTWNYVPSRDNPADLVSRGLQADLISECSLWWSGPHFLSKDEKYWPKKPNESMKQDLPEIASSHFIDSHSLIHNQIYHNHNLTSPNQPFSIVFFNQGSHCLEKVD